LAGFIERKGNFYISKPHKNGLSHRFYVRCRYQFQQLVDLSSTNEDTNQNTKSVYQSLLRRIANYFKSNILLESARRSKKKKNSQTYIIQVLTVESQDILISYLKRFQLFGNKLDILRQWCKVILMTKSPDWNQKSLICQLRVDKIKKFIKHKEKR
jgi:hypothetical protein